MTNCKKPNRFMPTITKIFIKDEGLEYSPYKDSKNLWTIGIGHLIGADLRQLKLSPAVVNLMFQEDVEVHWQDACEIFGESWLNNQTPARQAAILTLVYTLGERKIQSFIHTIPAIKAEKWALAAELLLKTKWASDVDPKQRPDEGRDDRIAFMLREGRFHEEYQID